jgi:chemotaxis protein methyltransferase CheR
MTHVSHAPAASEPLSDSRLAEVGAVVRERLGLHYPLERRRELEAALRAAAGSLGCADAAAAARRIVDQPLGADELKTLAAALTIGETNFCRDPDVFLALERDILPALIERRRRTDRRIRIWSAGCCTGEEPYTVAMILRRLLGDAAGWNITLLATDVNPQFLRRAEQGAYGPWSFRRTPGWMSRRHFSPRGDGKMEIHGDVRQLVTFEYLNLAEASYPSVYNNTNAMDVVLCRNVLIYFDGPTVERVVRRLGSCLLPGGWLALGRSERAPVDVGDLEPLRLRGDFWYRRREPRRPDDDGGGRRREPRPAARRAAPFPRHLQESFDAGEYAIVARDLPDYLSAGSPARSDRARAMRLLAQACANLGRLDEAQSWCEEALAENKLDARLHYLLASVQLERNQQDGAAISLQRAVFADDRFLLAHFALGTLQRRRRDAGRAREHFERVLSLLRHYRREEILPDSDGLTAGQLSEIAEQALSQC